MHIDLNSVKIMFLSAVEDILTLNVSGGRVVGEEEIAVGSGVSHLAAKEKVFPPD